MDAACIFLNDGIADAGIQPGSSLESIVQQLILLVTNPGCVDAPGGVPGGGTVTFIDAVWPGNAITIAGGPISNSGTFVFNGNGTSNQYIDGQGNLQTFPSISGPVEFQTNGTPNSAQDLLNLVAGTGVTLTESGGSVTIDVDANVYTVDNGLSADPTDANNFQLGSATSPGAPLIHDTYIAGAQFRFEINNTNSMFLQGNRVDIEGAAAGAMLLSTGGTNENSVEVDGTEVAIESTGAGATRIFLDPAKIRVQTPLFNTKANNDVLTLIDSATGEVEFMPPSGILLQTDGVDNADQTYLNLIPGNGIVLTNVDGDVTIDGPLFQTDGTDNSTQTLLNLVPGTGITMSESGGSVTINAEAPAINLTTTGTGGASTYNSGTGDLNIPVYQTQIDVQDEGTSRVINPTIINFVGDGVEVTNSGSEAIITIPGGGGGSADANNGLILNTTDYAIPTVQLGGPDTAPAPLVRNTYINTTAVSEYDFDISGSRVTKPIINVSNTGQGTAVKGISAGGYAIYGTTASGFSGYFEADNSLIGLYSVSKTGNLSAEFESVSSINNTVIPVVRIMRTVNISSPGVNGADGIGASVDFFLEDDNNVAAQAGAISYEFTDATSGATVSQFAVTTADAGSLSRKLEITGAGQLILNEYTTSTSFDPESGPSVGVLNVDATGKVFVGTGGGGSALAVEVDGTPLSSSTLLNFITSSDIAFTDLGGGDLSLSLVNPPVTYTSDEGVWDESGVFKLGAPVGLQGTIPFLENRYVDTSTFKLYFQGSGSANTVRIDNYYNPAPGQGNSNEALEVFSQFASGIKASAISNYAIGVTGAGGLFGKGVYGVASGVGVSGYGTADGIGGQFSNSSAITTALDSQNLGGYLAGIFTTGTSSTNTVTNNVWINTQSSGIAAAGLGARLNFRISPNSGLANTLAVDANALISKWHSTGGGSNFSEFVIKGAIGGSFVDQFAILGGGTAGPAGAWSIVPGQIKFTRYFSGSIYKSATDLVAASGFNLGIDADGNIWATDFSTGTGGTGVQDISIGTLSNGASASVTNPSGPSATINITGQNAYTQIQADGGTSASASVYNDIFKITGAQGIVTSVADGSPDTVTVNGPVKYLSFQLKDIGNNNILGGTYTPAAWNSILNIRAGSGITLSNDTGNANTLIISAAGGGGGVTNVSGTNANGFTVTVSNQTTTPNITIGTSVTGILVGDGSGGLTSVSTGGGSGVLTYNSTTNSYSFTTIPTVNDGTLTMAVGSPGATATTVTWGTATGFSANTANNLQYNLSVGPALTGLATIMTGGLPANPVVTPGGLTVLPRYLTKSGQDTYALATPVTTFSTGTTGFTLTSIASSATNAPINGAVILGGSLNVANGGTGLTTAPGNGQILIGNGTGFTLGNISQGTGITVTNTAGGIEIGATGITPNVKSGIYINGTDSSIRLGSGAQTTDPPALISPSPLLERAIVRLDSWLFRLADGNDGVVSDLGFDVSDLANVKRGYLGTTTKGFWFSSNISTAAAPTSAFQGFVYGGQTSNAFPTNMLGFLFTPSGSAAFPATFSGFGVDIGGSRTIMGFLGSSVYEIINRTGNIISQHGLWGGTGGTADFLMYQANATAKLISIGDVSNVGGTGTRFQINDTLKRFNFTTGLLYASGYGAALPVGLDAGSISRNFVLGTASDGKIYEIPAVSIGRITVAGSTPYTPTTLATAAAPNALTIQGAGTVSVGLSGSTLTITGGGTSAFPYWSTLSFAVSAGTTGRINGNPEGQPGSTSTVIPDVNGANTLNIQAGNNIDISTSDLSTNRVVISANFTPANSWGNITLGGNVSLVSPSVPGFVLSPDQVSDGLIINAGLGIGITVDSNTDTFNIVNNGVRSLSVNNTVDAFSVVTTSSGAGSLPGASPNTPILTIPWRWRQFTVTNVTTNIPTTTSGIVPTLAADSINFNGGPGIQLRTDVSTKTVHISSTAASANAWYTIDVANGSAAGGTTSLIPNLSQDTLTIAGGTGISVSTNPTGFTDRVVVTNTGVTSVTAGGTTLTGAVTLAAGTNVGLSVSGSTITINSSGGPALTANQGIDIVSNVILLGTTAQGANPFLANRFITTLANTLGINGTPGTNQPIVNIVATPTGTGSIAIRAENNGTGHGIQASSLGDGNNTSHAGVFVHTGSNAVEQDILKLVRGSNFSSGTGIGFYSANTTRNGFVGYNTDGYLAKTGANASLATRHQIYTTGQHRFNNYVGSSSFPIPPVYADYRDGLALVVDRNASAGDTGKVSTMPLVSAYLNSSVSATPTASPVIAGATSYTKVGNIVTVMVTVQFTYSSNPTGSTVIITLGLPRNAQTNQLIDANPTNLLHSLSWQSFTSIPLFTGYTASISNGTVVVSLTRTNATPIPSNTNIFTLIYTYVASPAAP
jgi:hypothetical protein